MIESRNVDMLHCDVYLMWTTLWIMWITGFTQSVCMRMRARVTSGFSFDQHIAIQHKIIIDRGPARRYCAEALKQNTPLWQSRRNAVFVLMTVFVLHIMRFNR